MRCIIKIILIFMLVSSAGPIFSQDFFAEETDSVPDFYANNLKLAVVGIADPFHNFYGGALWIHHRKARFSTYAECKYNITPEAVIYATNATGTSRMSVSASRRVFVLGSGIGSTIYENYLWYANIGLRYTNYGVVHKPIPDHKLDQVYPFRIHYGAGLAAVFLNHIHGQIGIDFETMNINVGAGFVF